MITWARRWLKWLVHGHEHIRSLNAVVRSQEAELRNLRSQVKLLFDLVVEIEKWNGSIAAQIATVQKAQAAVEQVRQEIQRKPALKKTRSMAELRQLDDSEQAFINGKGD